MLRRNMWPPSSGSKKKPVMKPAGGSRAMIASNNMCYSLHHNFFHSLFFYAENGGNKFLRNVGLNVLWSAGKYNLVRTTFYKGSKGLQTPSPRIRSSWPLAVLCPGWCKQGPISMARSSSVCGLTERDSKKMQSAVNPPMHRVQYWKHFTFLSKDILLRRKIQFFL
jgi:hypothetical protein